MSEEKSGWWVQQGPWLIKLFLISLILAIALKTIAPLYPLPETLPVVLACLMLPALMMAVFLSQIRENLLNRWMN